jgi:hypothetical protein
MACRGRSLPAYPIAVMFLDSRKEHMQLSRTS